MEYRGSLGAGSATLVLLLARAPPPYPPIVGMETRRDPNVDLRGSSRTLAHRIRPSKKTEVRGTTPKNPQPESLDWGLAILHTPDFTSGDVDLQPTCANPPRDTPDFRSGEFQFRPSTGVRGKSPSAEASPFHNGFPLANLRSTVEWRRLEREERNADLTDGADPHG
jgi:hypothetical protein